MEPQILTLKEPENHPKHFIPRFEVDDEEKEADWQDNIRKRKIFVCSDHIHEGEKEKTPCS
jgi:hypothetical protein